MKKRPKGKEIDNSKNRLVNIKNHQSHQERSGQMGEIEGMRNTIYCDEH